MDVIIVNYNTCQHLRDCLRAVCGEAPSQVTVVDSASSDGSVEMVRAEFPQVRVLANRENLGYGASVNAAAKDLGAPYFLALNADTKLLPETLRPLRAYLEENPRVAVVGPKLTHMDGRLQRSARRFPGTAAWLVDNHTIGGCFSATPVLRNLLLNAWSYSRPRRVPWVTGAALAVRREAFEEVQGFDESYYMYFEEVDLCWRLMVAGWETHFAPVARVAHVGGASTKQRSSEMAFQYVSSAMRFYQRRYHPVRVALAAGIMRIDLLWQMFRDATRRRAAIHGAERQALIDDLATRRKLLLRFGGPPWVSMSDGPTS